MRTGSFKVVFFFVATYQKKRFVYGIRCVTFLAREWAHSQYLKTKLMVFLYNATPSSLSLICVLNGQRNFFKNQNISRNIVQDNFNIALLCLSILLFGIDWNIDPKWKKRKWDEIHSLKINSYIISNLKNIISNNIRNNDKHQRRKK